MSFLIRRQREHGLDLVEIEDTSNGTVISLLPGFGAILHAFAVRTADGSAFNVIDNYAGLAELEAELGLSFKGPKLSPDPGRQVSFRREGISVQPSFRRWIGHPRASL